MIYSWHAYLLIGLFVLAVWLVASAGGQDWERSRQRRARR